MALSFDRALGPLIKYVPCQIKANHITVLRGALVLPLYFARHHALLAVFLVIFSSFLDILDGVVARVRGETKNGGDWLDPLADKIFVIGAATFLVVEGRIWLPLYVALAALEGLLFLLRPIKRMLGASGKSKDVGKIKTWVESFALGFVFSQFWAFVWIAPLVFVIGIVLALGSCWKHTADCLKILARP